MAVSAADLDRARPAGSRRSSKRDAIVNVFLRQEGHLGADDLVELIRREDQQISRATVYRTLQWMVEAGIARKVDLGQGRFRFEHSYRHPRHFHLICKSCDSSFEFLSADIEARIEEVATARAFSARQSVLQIYGTCEACRSGRPPAGRAATTSLVFARDALRIAMATERSGDEFYTRAARITRDPRTHGVLEALASAGRERLAALEARYLRLLREDPALESRPTFLFFKGAANGLFSESAEALGRSVTTREALRLAIRAARRSHRFFKRYGERFEDAEGRRLFLGFAATEREHLDILIREVRALDARSDARPARRRARAPARRARARRRSGA